MKSDRIIIMTGDFIDLNKRGLQSILLVYGLSVERHFINECSIVIGFDESK